MFAFFRNPEIKKLFCLHGILFTAIIFSGLLLGRAYLWYGIILSLLWNSLFFIKQYHNYRRLADLNQSLDTILFTEKMLPLQHYKEGEFSILATNIEKLLLRLQDKQNLLSKDKRFLADSIADISHQIRTPLASLQLLIKNYQGTEDKQARRR